MRKLLLTIIIDNSSSMKGEKITKLKQALTMFHEKINSPQLQNNLHYQVIGFNNLQAKIFKDFTDDHLDCHNINEGGLALLNQALNLGLNNLEKNINEFKKQGYSLFKPWFVLLFDGQCYEDLNNSLTKLITLIQNKQITYFPFGLSDNQSDERLENLQKVKRPLIIVNNLYDKLFNWLLETVYKRLTTPIEKGIKLEKKAFAGWIK